MHVERDQIGSARDQPNQSGICPARQKKTKSGAEGGEKNAFGQQLTDQSPGSGSHADADGQFFLSGGGANQQNVRHIGARDQENKADDSHQNLQRLGEISAQCRGPATALDDGQVLIQKHAPLLCRHLIGLRLQHLLEDRIEIGVRLVDSHPLLQASDCLQPLGFVKRLCLQ